MKRRPQSRVVRGRGRPAPHVEPQATGLRELVSYLARGLVDEPEAVQVTEVKREGELVLELRVAPGDLGNVIGRNGRTAGAIRTLLAAGATPGERAFLDILD
jgi:predicted RNA-binding protein YlqC (UPF0109 family)